MKKEYLEVYDLVKSFNFSSDYVKFKYGTYSLTLFSPDYSIFNGFKYCVTDISLDGLKNQIKELLTKEAKTK